MYGPGLPAGYRSTAVPRVDASLKLDGNFSGGSGVASGCRALTRATAVGERVLEMSATGWRAKAAKKMEEMRVAAEKAMEEMSDKTTLAAQAAREQHDA
eukprot:SAG22_NODE_8322_length_664_cov_1.359292_1_plen_98_part_10